MILPRARVGTKWLERGICDMAIVSDS